MIISCGPQAAHSLCGRSGTKQKPFFKTQVYSLFNPLNFTKAGEHLKHPLCLFSFTFSFSEDQILLMLQPSGPNPIQG